MRSQTSPLVLASYNIHRCIGTDGKFNPDRVIEVIRQLNADIVALQEVETPNGEGLDLIEYFGSQTSMQSVAGLTMFDKNASYGNALLSRLDILDLQRIDISIEGREPRGALCVKTSCADTSIQIIATHLGLLPSERRRQVKQLLGVLEHRSADISVLMGDLNEWYLWGRPLKWLRNHFGKSMSPNTFPSKYPFLALDRIWVEPRSSLTKVASHQSSLAKLASDHLPLKAILSF